MEYAVLVVVYATLFVASPLIVVLHELGHALAYLWLTKPDRIDIYIGSYGDTDKSIGLKVNKLNFYIKRSFPFIKGIGLCKSHTAESNYLNKTIILLAGPVFTLFISVIPVVVILNTNAHVLVSISCYIFLGLCTLSLVTNLTPIAIKTTSQVGLDSDGKQIFFTLKIRKVFRDYIEAIHCFEQKDFEKAIAKFKIVVDKVPNDRKVLRLTIKAAMQAKKLDEVDLYLAKLESRYELTVSDLLDKGYLQSSTNRNDEAIETYQKILKRDRNNLIALNNIGAELIEKGAHIVAKRTLDRAIKINPQFDLPYCNLGYSNILQGNLQEGKDYLDHSIRLNPYNADAYNYLGSYYLKMGNVYEANVNFAKASEINQPMNN